jgi:hypothetical protein
VRAAAPKAGELLASMEKAKPTGSNQHEDWSHDVTDPPTLSDLGIEKMQSHRWQNLIFSRSRCTLSSRIKNHPYGLPARGAILSNFAQTL